MEKIVDVVFKAKDGKCFQMEKECIAYERTLELHIKNNNRKS